MILRSHAQPPSAPTVPIGCPATFVRIPYRPRGRGVAAQSSPVAQLELDLSEHLDEAAAPLLSTGPGCGISTRKLMALAAHGDEAVVADLVADLVRLGAAARGQRESAVYRALVRRATAEADRDGVLWTPRLDALWAIRQDEAVEWPDLMESFRRRLAALHTWVEAQRDPRVLAAVLQFRAWWIATTVVGFGGEWSLGLAAALAQHHAWAVGLVQPSRTLPPDVRRFIRDWLLETLRSAAATPNPPAAPLCGWLDEYPLTEAEQDELLDALAALRRTWDEPTRRTGAAADAVASIFACLRHTPRLGRARLERLCALSLAFHDAVHPAAGGAFVVPFVLLERGELEAAFRAAVARNAREAEWVEMELHLSRNIRARGIPALRKRMRRSRRVAVRVELAHDANAAEFQAHLRWLVRHDAWCALALIERHPTRASTAISQEELLPLLQSQDHQVRVAASATLRHWGGGRGEAAARDCPEP